MKHPVINLNMHGNTAFKLFLLVVNNTTVYTCKYAN